MRDGTTMMNGYFGIEASLSIVLEAMVEQYKPLLDCFYWFSALLLSLPVFCCKFERKRAFPVPTSAKTTTIRAPFKLAISGSTVLDTIAKKMERSYEHFACLSQLQSSLPV